jgi:predicted DNA-binding protein
MSQLALYLDDETANRIDEAARRRGMSRSAWVRAVIQKQLDEQLPDSFFDVLGTWQDDRTPEEIVKDIRAGDDQAERPEIE